MAPVIPIRSGASLAPLTEPAPQVSSGSHSAAASEAGQPQHTPLLPRHRPIGSSAQRIFSRPGFTRSASVRSEESFRTANSHRSGSSAAGSARSRSQSDGEQGSIAASNHEGKRPSLWSALFGKPAQHQRTARRPGESDRASLRSGSARSDRRANAEATQLRRNQGPSAQIGNASKTTHHALQGFLPPAKAVWHAADIMTYATIGLATGVVMIGLFPVLNVGAVPVAMAGGACAAVLYAGASRYLRNMVLGSKNSSS